MEGYISKDKVVDLLCRWTEHHMIDPIDLVVMSLKLEKEPAVDATSVESGMWVDQSEDLEPCTWSCSKCGNVVMSDDNPNWNYCSECGAKMDSKTIGERRKTGMNEYITKEQALAAVKDAVDAKEEALETIALYIDALTTSDVAPVVHGENASEAHPSDEFECSECGLVLQDYIECINRAQEAYREFTDFRFCPRCGAEINQAQNILVKGEICHE